MNDLPRIDISIVIVSFNTRELLRQCLLSAMEECASIKSEIIVIDNASKDKSAEMVKESFPTVKLIQNQVNLGFAAANNLGFRQARGEFIVLLNSDAFLHKGSLKLALRRIEGNPTAGLGGGRLIGRDGSWQPSARMFPSILNDFLHLSGLAAKYPDSHFFGRADRTWASAQESTETDWVPGAFAIARREVLEKVGFFDERFFLYYEEVDLCQRIKQAGYSIWYWADVVITHLGGESSKTIRDQAISSAGSQLTLWKMRSALLYYYKYQGRRGASRCKNLETWWHKIRILKNRLMKGPGYEKKIQESEGFISQMQQAWEETNNGQYSPPKPW